MRKTVLLFALLLTAFMGVAQEQKFITSDGVNLYVKVKGKGIPCLYIHGGPGSGSFWMEKFSGDLLEEYFQMIYIDLRGVGRSSSPEDGNYSMDRMVKDFEEIRNHLGIQKWLIMGHSFSGTMLTDYSLNHSNSIKGMLMFNCTLNIKESINENWIPYAVKVLDLKEEWYYKDAGISFHEKLNKLFPLLNENGLTWKMAYASKENEEIMNATFSEIPDWNGDFSGIGMFHEDYLRDFKQYTAKIDVPVLFFYGKTDWTVGPEHYKGIKFPNMLLWGSQVGHIPFMENKKDMKKAIERFLKKSHL